MIPFECGSGDRYELEVPFSSPFHDVLPYCILISLSELGKAKRLPQNYFVSIREGFSVVIHDKEGLCNKVLML